MIEFEVRFSLMSTEPPVNTSKPGVFTLLDILDIIPDLVTMMNFYSGAG